MPLLKRQRPAMSLGVGGACEGVGDDGKVTRVTTNHKCYANSEG